MCIPAIIVINYFFLTYWMALTCTTYWLLVNVSQIINKSQTYCEKVYEGVALYKPKLTYWFYAILGWVSCNLGQKQLVSSTKCRGGGVSAKNPKSTVSTPCVRQLVPDPTTPPPPPPDITSSSNLMACSLFIVICTSAVVKSYCIYMYLNVYCITCIMSRKWNSSWGRGGLGPL